MALILGIETSCDETAVAVVRDGVDVLGNSVASQIAKHAPYGGVVPELAAREHLTALPTVAAAALEAAGLSSAAEADAVAVTTGPGLMPALLVGVNFAKGLSMSLSKPLIAVDHFMGHIYGTFLDMPGFDFSDESLYPMLALIVSGGHTALVVIGSDGAARMVGTTIDDAAGEAFDKAAKLLNLGYPGGPLIEKTGASGNPRAFDFPRSLTGAAGKVLDERNKYNFSFSGVKTALLYHCRRHGDPEKMSGDLLHDTVASYQEAIVDALCRKTLLAAGDFNVKSVILSGGVACNNPLRERFASVFSDKFRLFLAQKKYCTDNAAMIAGLAHYSYLEKDFASLDADAYARLPGVTRAPFVASAKR